MKRTIDTILWPLGGVILGLALAWMILGCYANAVETVTNYGTTITNESVRVQWSNDEGLKWQDFKWKEHCRQYGVWASNVMFAYSANTNWAIAHIQSGTNWVPVELGFRSDGYVVWRKR